MAECALAAGVDWVVAAAAVLEARRARRLLRNALPRRFRAAPAALADPEPAWRFSAEVALWEAIERGFTSEAIGLLLADSAFDANAFGAVGSRRGPARAWARPSTSRCATAR